MRVLFLNHKSRECGVYQFGQNIARALLFSSKDRTIFHYREVRSREEYLSTIAEDWDAVIVNYYPTTMPWLYNSPNTKSRPLIGIVHEITDLSATKYLWSPDPPFTHHLLPDPRLAHDGPVSYRTGRCIPQYNAAVRPQAQNGVPWIGSFGFGFANKGFERLVEMVGKQFQKAHIRLHIPFAQYGDTVGHIAMERAANCQTIAKTYDVSIEIDHEFWDPNRLMYWLSQNSLNCFLYDQNDGRGIASVIDYALAVPVPIAITNTSQFRHITKPEICVESRTLPQIMDTGISPLAEYKNAWTEYNLNLEYTKIIQRILS